MHRAGMYGRNSSFYFISPTMWWPGDWIRIADQSNLTECNADELLEAANNSIGLSVAGFQSGSEKHDLANRTLDEIQEIYHDLCDTTSDGCHWAASYLYDGLWQYAYMFHEWLEEEGGNETDLYEANETVANFLYNYSVSVPFQGTTGYVSFLNGSGDRDGLFDIKQIRRTDQQVVLGSWSTHNGFAWNNDSFFQWNDGTTFFPANKSGFRPPDRPNPCLEGQYIDSNGNCQDCLPGSFSNAKDERLCQLCQPGQYANETASTSCKNCEAGTYSDEGAAICTQCSPGSYQDLKGQSSCLTCTPGTYSDTIGAQTCEQCEVGSFNPYRNATSCQPCNETKTTFSRGEISASACTCPTGSYLDYKHDRCRTCGDYEGLVCARVDMEEGHALPRLEVNYFAFVLGDDYNLTFDAPSVFRCRDEGACLGGSLDPALQDDFPMCAEGRDSKTVSCSLCGDEYYKTGGVCKPCARSGTSSTVIFWLVLVLLLFFGLFFHFFVNSPITRRMAVTLNISLTMGMIINFMQSLSIVGTFNIGFPGRVREMFNWATIFVLDVQFLRPGCVFGDDPLTDYILRLSVPLFLTLIFLLNFLIAQGAYRMMLPLLERYGLVQEAAPTPFLSFKPVKSEGGGKRLSLKFDRQTPEGLPQFDFAKKMKMKKSASIAVVGREPLSELKKRPKPMQVFGIPLIREGTPPRDELMVERKKAFAKEDERARRHINTGKYFESVLNWKAWLRSDVMSLDKTINTIGMMINILYIAFVSNVCVIFQCFEHPNGRYTVREHPEITCFDPETGYGKRWTTTYLPLGIFGLLVYVIGVFVYFAWISYISPFHFDEPGFRTRYRFLFFRFRPDVYWWGSILLLRNCLLAMVPAIVPNDGHLQIFLTICLLLIFLGLQIFFWPWRSVLNNVMDVAMMLSLSVLAAAGFYFIEKREENSHIFSTIILVSVSVCVSVVLVGVVLPLFTEHSPRLRRVFEENLLGLAYDLRIVGRACSRMSKLKIMRELEELPQADIYKLRSSLIMLKMEVVSQQDYLAALRDTVALKKHGDKIKRQTSVQLDWKFIKERTAKTSGRLSFRGSNRAFSDSAKSDIDEEEYQEEISRLMQKQHFQSLRTTSNMSKGTGGKSPTIYSPKKGSKSPGSSPKEGGPTSEPASPASWVGRWVNPLSPRNRQTPPDQRRHIDQKQQQRTKMEPIDEHGAGANQNNDQRPFSGLHPEQPRLPFLATNDQPSVAAPASSVGGDDEIPEDGPVRVGPHVGSERSDIMSPTQRQQMEEAEEEELQLYEEPLYDEADMLSLGLDIDAVVMEARQDAAGSGGV
uniref:Tyrosine-protein kinase ephrin type A/B receptor-like domain-containing protein n=1 Tax=Vitrella brassicaformis TaxID=1169539 RepID=A0A6U4BQC4_9ALVE